MPGINYSAHQFNPIAHGHGEAIKAAKKDSQSVSFGDLLDAVNPLQHLPVVSVLYRHLTGDTISPAAKVVGDTAYGGPLGLLSSLGDMLFQKMTGKSAGDMAYAMVTGDDTVTVEGATAVAAAETSAGTEEADVAAAPAEVLPAISAPSLTALPAALGETVGEVAEKTSAAAVKAYRAAGHLLAAY